MTSPEALLLASSGDGSLSPVLAGVRERFPGVVFSLGLGEPGSNRLSLSWVDGPPVATLRAAVPGLVVSRRWGSGLVEEDALDLSREVSLEAFVRLASPRLGFWEDSVEVPPSGGDALWAMAHEWERTPPELWEDMRTLSARDLSGPSRPPVTPLVAARCEVAARLGRDAGADSVPLLEVWLRRGGWALVCALVPDPHRRDVRPCSDVPAT